MVSLEGTFSVYPEKNLIGLTGGIGAGKSVVARILRSKGFEVYDCDLRAKELMQTSESIRKSLIRHFGESCFGPDGAIDRKYLAHRIFSSSKERLMMNFIVHSAIRDDVLKRVRSQEMRYGILFVESAILHSSMLDRYCSCVWHITAPEETRFSRAMNRGGIDPENLRSRIEAQKGEFDKILCEKIVEIDNSQDMSILAQVNNALVSLF